MRCATIRGALRLKILLIHNFYQLRGGECAVFESEQQMLRAAGHEIVLYTRHSDEISDAGWLANATLPLRTIWNPESHRALAKLISRESPDVAHFTNTFPLISPSAYAACRAAGVPIVQSIHNYRWLCPAATFFRNGAICEECVEHSLLRSIRYGCYRGSRSASATVAAMIAANRRNLFHEVDRFIALTQFARQKLIEGGFPSDRIAVKPNSVDFEPDPPLPAAERNHALFAGRLSPEKGVHTLLDAWRQLSTPVPLQIAGDGPLRESIERRIAEEAIGGIELLGPLLRAELLDNLRRARVLVFPSTWYEGMPMAIVEAFASGTPVVASRLGGMAEMVEDGRNGLLFRAQDATELAAKLQAVIEDDRVVDSLGRGARDSFDEHHRPAANCERLLEIYRNAIAANASRTT